MSEQIIIQEKQVVEKVVNVVAVKAFQWFIDGTDNRKPGGITIIKGYLISDEGQVVGQRTWAFSGNYYASKVDMPVNTTLTHRDDFLETTNEVLTEIATNPTLRDELIASGELVIDPFFVVRINLQDGVVTE